MAPLVGTFLPLVGLSAADEVPPITRDGASEAARRELAKAIYHRDDDPWWLRGLVWVAERLRELLEAASARSPGGVAGLLALLVLVVTAALAVRLRAGPVRRTAGRAALFPGLPLTAADHRVAAERHAAAGKWAEALRDRLRAIVRELEEAAVLEPRPGRTADEAASEAGAALPMLAEDLAAAARRFDEVWYGERLATAIMHDRLRRLDGLVQAQVSGTRVPVGSGR